MRAPILVVTGLLMAASLTIASSSASAQESLGDVAADEAVVDLLESAGDGVELTCTFVGGWVTCAGAKVGVCLSAGWLVNHNGGTCRKKVG